MELGREVSKVHKVLTIVFVSWALGSGVGSASGLTGLDEYWHSMRTAIQTWATGSWWLPVLDGEVRVEKPPLLYWLMMASFSAFGVEFWAARLPSVLLGLSFAYLVATLYVDLFKRSHLLPLLITVSLLTVAVESRRAMLDLPVAVCTVATLIALLRQQRSPSSLWWVAASLAATAGFYFKGPVAIWFIATGVFALYALRGESIRTSKLLAMSMLTFVLISLWPILLTVHSPDWADRLLNDGADRQLGWPTFKNLQSVLGGLAVVSLPWLFVALGFHPNTGTESEHRITIRSLWGWVFIAILPFFFMRTFERYLLPLSIPIVLLTTYVLHFGDRTRRFQLLSAVVLTALPVVSMTLITSWLATSIWVVTATVVTISLLAVAASCAWRRSIIAMIALLITSTTLTLGYVYPQLGVNRIPSEVVLDFETKSGAHYASPYPGTLSMVLGRSVPFIESGDERSLRSHAQVSGLLILRADDLPSLEADARLLSLDVMVERRFSMWYSRGSFLRLSKAGLTPEEQWRAIKERDLIALKPEFITARISMRPII